MPYVLQDVRYSSHLKHFFFFKQNGKMGMINGNTGEIIIKPIYDNLTDYYIIYGDRDFRLVSEMDKKFGIIYLKNNKIIEIKPVYDKMIFENDYDGTKVIDESYTWYLNSKKYKYNGVMQKFIPYVDKYSNKGAGKETLITPPVSVIDVPPVAPKKISSPNPKVIEMIYIIPKTEAVFVGKEGKTLENFVVKNMQYPQKAIDNKIEGIVEMEITINKENQVTNPKITKSLGYGCDEEAIRIINLTNYLWKPATFDNNNRYETFTSIKRLKVVFKLPKK